MSEFQNCTLCPRACGADRTKGKSGFCRTGEHLLVARAAPHHWEEPCISGAHGSGTVFFAGCNLGCVYCQNEEISRGNAGKEITPERLFKIFFELKEQGVHNINLVTPSHFLPAVLPVIQKAKAQNIGIPFVMNTSGYDCPDMISKTKGLIDIYLSDFKYLSSSLSARYSHAENYGEIAKAALMQMVRNQPSCEFDKSGMMTRGVIVRHLLLPGCLKDAKEVLTYLYETYQNQIYISIMNQFTPTKALVAYSELNRTVTTREYDSLIDHAVSLGITQAFVQEGETQNESFIPPFDLQGV